MNKRHINYWLLPLAWLYGGVISLRNKLFDWGWLQSKSFHVPIICIGNLAVGGTGKTPHTEYLIRLLQGQGWSVATLSRGYKRRSTGFVLATATSTADDLGDEPLQMRNKFPRLHVAVDANRCRGINQLLQLPQPPQVVLLDDAYQHRYVRAGLNILLTDYHRLWCDDALLPAGRLREPMYGRHRAQIIIVTKCPDNLKPIDYNIVAKRLQIHSYQAIYFSRLHYGALYPLFPQVAAPHPIVNATASILLVSGIANPDTLLHEVQRHGSQVIHLAYPDHHHFSNKDLADIERHFSELKGENRLLITTEKDASRLITHPALSDGLKPYIYVLPIEIEILNNQKESFNKQIIHYVRTYSRNSRLH